jgi:ArsR family transcriptional regulator, arsenate/arsenite/antimonite-responsive transcriptional repressor
MARTVFAAQRRGPDVTDLDALFRGFADPTRIRILNLLVAGEMCVCDLVDILQLPQPTVSRHLAYLRGAGLVAAKRDSNYAHYRLTDATNDIHQNLIDCVQGCFTGIKSLDSERRRAIARVKQRDKVPCQ